MKAIILAGGLGTRLRPLTNTIPKPLLLIKGKPIIEHAITNLKKHGISDIILSIGYKAGEIKKYFGDGIKFGVNISYSIEEEPLGTGGAVRFAAKDIKEHFILLWGDNLMDLDVSRLINSHKENNAKITMTLTPREDVEHFGVAKLDAEKILHFVEKPKREEAPSNLINAGAFVINPDALKILPEGKSNIERECFELLAKQGVVYAYKHPGQWFPTDTLEKYKKADEEFNP
ncbi:nucleotidyltransferase family protein [Candidatus Woesearchaeota archaeon]|nr:nucleotidyltransferase family protein [Candidatus Woesearchaeota archaeon]